MGKPVRSLHVDQAACAISFSVSVNTPKAARLSTRAETKANHKSSKIPCWSFQTINLLTASTFQRTGQSQQANAKTTVHGCGLKGRSEHKNRCNWRFAQKKLKWSTLRVNACIRILNRGLSAEDSVSSLSSSELFRCYRSC